MRELDQKEIGEVNGGIVWVAVFFVARVAVSYVARAGVIGAAGGAIGGAITGALERP